MRRAGQAYDHVKDAFKKHVSRSSVKSGGPMAIETFLEQPINLKYFKSFCIKEMSVENLLFWLEVTDYKTIEAPEYRKAMAKKIYRKYCQIDAPMGIAVKDATRKKVNIPPGTTPDLALFDQLQQEVLLSMKMDIYPRFCESEEYHELLDLKFEQRKVVDITDFDLVKFLGAGGFGMVLQAKKKDTGKYYAVKVIDKRILLSQNQTHSIFREKEVLAYSDHPYIVGMRYAFQTVDHLCLVLDFIEGGNMYSDLMRGPYTHERACFYAAEIVLATQHLHESDIIYRDLKPDNVLVSLDGHCKLADMGTARGLNDTGTINAGDDATASASLTAKTVDPAKGRRMTITGTHGYRAPEVYDRVYGKPADWWNVGILVIEMLTAENPLRGDNRRESEQLTKHKDVNSCLPAYMQPEAKNIALRLLDRNQATRLGCGEKGVREIKEHPFFAPIDWEKLMAGEMDVPFEPDLEYREPKPEQIPPQFTNQLDYFCTKVDFMQNSMAARKQWELSEREQETFTYFNFVSNRVFEEELMNAMVTSPSGL